MIEPWSHAIESIESGVRTTVVVVVESRGSVPGTPGAVMIVTVDRAVGTVGGGAAERHFVELARTYDGPPALFPFDHHELGDSICSGHQTIAVMALEHADLPVLESLSSSLEASGFGCLTVTNRGVTFDPDVRSPTSFDRDADVWSFTTTLGRLETLHLVGGGHVSLAVSRVVVTLPFRVVVLDDRSDLETLTTNRWADETRVVDYTEIGSHVAQGPSSWAVIMTHGHRHDEAVLDRLLNHDLCFLGMLGSKAKVAQIFANLEQRGVSSERLSRVHAPVGLRIRSHTPAEIAVSIAAQLVALRNR